MKTPSQHPIVDASDALYRKAKRQNPYKQFKTLCQNVSGQGPGAERAVFHAVLVTFALINRRTIAEFYAQESGVSATKPTVSATSEPKRKYRVGPKKR